MSCHFVAAAKRYCEAREADRVLRLDMKPCEDHEEAEDRDGLIYDKVAPCWRAYSIHDEEVIPDEDWCPSCQHNLAIIEESRKIRKRFGGLASAMMAAYRSSLAPAREGEK